MAVIWFLCFVSNGEEHVSPRKYKLVRASLADTELGRPELSFRFWALRGSCMLEEDEDGGPYLERWHHKGWEGHRGHVAPTQILGGGDLVVTDRQFLQTTRSR